MIQKRDNGIFFIENNANTPYIENGFIHYGKLVELCEDIDGDIMAVAYAISKSDEETEQFIKDPSKYMFKYSSPKYIG